MAKRTVLMSGAFGAGIIGTAFFASALTGAAWAADPELVIDGTRTTPASTSTSGDITVEDTGRVTIDDEGVAILNLDSNNDITVESGAQLTHSAGDDGIGIYIESGNTGNLSFSGSLLMGETNPDIEVGTNLTGIMVGRDGDTLDPFTGNISFGNAATFVLYGDESTGVAINRRIVGDLTFDGSIAVNGLNSRGIVTAAEIDGQIVFNANVVTRGTALPSATDLDPLSGATVAIGANVTGGFYVQGPITDLDGNAPAQIRSVGSAPAVYISPTVGGATGNVAIGLFEGYDDDDPIVVDNVGNFSFVNRGTVQTDGLEPGVNSEGFRIEGDGVHTVTFAGGIYNNGGIGATASSSTLLTAAELQNPLPSNATGLIIGEGASVPQLYNNGNVSASTSGPEGGTATAILIEDGGNLPLINNNSAINASSVTTDVENDNIVAYGIRDLSGTLTTINNTGFIETTVTTTDPGSRAIAIDVSAATTKVTINNTEKENGLSAAAIRGDILFGTAVDNVLNINGRISNDDGVSRALVEGRILTPNGGGVDIKITDGTLRTAEAQARDITIGPGTGPGTDSDSQGTLEFVLALEPGDEPIVVASGSVAFQEGSRVGFSSLSFLPDGGIFDLVSAQGGITFQNYEEATAFAAPYLYTTSFIFDDALVGEDVLSLSLQRKTAADLGLTGNRAAIYEAAALAAREDDLFGRGLISITNQAGVEEALDSLVPNIGAGARALTVAVTDSVNGPIGRRQRNLVTNPEEGLRFWGQQFYEDMNGATTSSSTSYFGSGLGVSGGVEWGDSPNARYGISYSYFAGQVTESNPRATKENIALNLVSAYANWRWNNFFITPQVNVGYASYDNRRRVVAGAITRTPISDWSTYLTSGGVSSGFLFNVGGFDIIPHISVDGLYMYETAYTERFGGNGVNLNLDSRTTSSVRLFAGVIAQTEFMLDDGILKPQILAGWSQELISDRPVIDASFEAVAGSDFSVVGPKSSDSRLIGGASFQYLFDNWSAGFNYDAAQTSGAFAQSATVTMTSRF